MSFKSIQVGTYGLDMEWNFIQNENPVGMIKVVRWIIYDDRTEKEAIVVYNTTKSAKLEFLSDF
jgi:hypothetical protein